MQTATRLALLLTGALVLHSAAARCAGEVVVFSEGAARAYLDVDAEFVTANALDKPVDDLKRCFRLITGVPLPSTARQVACFSPEAGLRAEAKLISMEDFSEHAVENGTVSLVLTPTHHMEGHPLAGAGEKAVWNCTWQRGGEGRLQFSLVVANQPYEGPGYGPFTFATLDARVPTWPASGVDLALELRSAGGPDLRGGYRPADGEWVYTDWFDPRSAGADAREPGVSDKNGPQGWAADWPEKWAGRTACYVTGYGAKLRRCRMQVDDVRLSSGPEPLYADGFDAPDGTAGGALPHWLLGPRQGKASVQGGALLLEPDSEGWSTVGLLAARQGDTPPDGARPLRMELTAAPTGADPFSPHVVQGWEMEAGPEAITLRAHTRLGLQNAIYGLLDRWGCRWVMVGELGECIPRADALNVPAGVTTFSPHSDFSVEPCGAGTPYAEFFERNQGGFANWLTGQHYWLYAIPPEKHFAAHPEWYSLIAGEREPRQLCTGNPEVIAEMIRVAKAYLAGGSNRIAFPMDPMDGIDFCQCDACRALDVPGQFTSGAPSVTDRVLHFANAVAAGIEDEFPDRHVALYAYWTHSDPPLRERPADNVIVIITRSNNCLLHLTPTAQCPASDFESFVRSWQRLTPSVYVYEYDPISWTGGLPCPIYLEMGRFLRRALLELGVKGSYSDMGVLPAASAGTFLNRYIPLRMKVNAEQQPEDVLADACRAFFGPAAEAMQQHYETMAQVTTRPHPGLSAIGVGTTYYHRLFWPDQIAGAREALDRGIAAAQGQVVYEQRVAMVDLAQRYLEAYLEGVWAAEADEFDRSVAAFGRMDRALATLVEKGWADGKDAPGRAKVMRLKALAEHFPQRLGYVTQWRILGPFDNSDANADQQRDPFEPLKDASTPVRLADGREAAWWDYTSPGGFLNLEQATGERRGDWVLSYAYAATVYDAPRDLSARLKLDSFFAFRVFVNGEEVFHRPGLNADCPDRNVVDVRLRQGPNTIVVKLSQTQITTDSFPWGLYLRVEVDDAQEAIAIPDTWRFATDPHDQGLAEGWANAGFDDGSWRDVRLGRAWEEAIGPYDGFAWYRARVAVPAELPAGRLALRFGGVDEEAWVYFNGELIGERTVKSTGKTVGEIWEEPFDVTVPREKLRPGEDNLLAVRVHDSAYAGGLYRGVKLVVVP